MADEVNELQREWRAIVLEKLSSLEQGQKDMRTDIVDIKTSFAKQHALEELKVASRAELQAMKDKIDDLSAFRYKLVGIAIGANLVITALAWIVTHHAG